jgi:hypothetical protein
MMKFNAENPNPFPEMRREMNERFENERKKIIINGRLKLLALAVVYLTTGMLILCSRTLIQ